jgi:hypothetical protein
MMVCGQEIRTVGRLVRIAGLSADTYEFLDRPEATIDALKATDERIDLLTFMQRLPETLPKYNYYMEWDNLAVLPVSTFDGWWTKQINDKTRNMARRAEKKGVLIRQRPLDEEYIKGVWKIYNECEIRQGKRFPHYGKDLDAVRKMMVTFPERSVFMGAYFEDEMIGFVRLHWDSSRIQAGISSILSLNAHRDKAPTNALLAESVRYCAMNAFPYLVYSRYSDGNKQRDSLMDFKDHNGFQRVNLPRFYVPLTPWGRIALSLGLHRRFLDYIPDSVLSQLRVLRKSWYSWKVRSA